MKRDEPEESNEPMVLAGFTYLAQFIDHDLTLDVTPLARAHPCAERMQNFRSPFLDLDQLYGGGPTVSPFLYHRERIPGNERFLIGKTRKPNGEEGVEEDLPRNPQGIALVADPREDENLIVAQLHVTFLKYHNLIMEKLEKEEVPSAGPSGGTIFEQARRLLTWYYQQGALYLVEDLVDQTVFKTISKSISKKPPRNGRFRVPIEFSAAAFRFGHSMVRDTYDYNETHEGENRATLEQLLRQTGMGGETQPSLRDDWVIDLNHFFDLQSTAINNARKIGPKIAGALYQLHPNTVKLFSAPSAIDKAANKSQCEVEDPQTVLPIRNLWRGARMGLPTGQDIAKALGVPNPLANEEIAKDQDSVFIKNRFHEETPLWYYVLKEAEILRLGKGRRLGPVGSWIVTKTIVTALQMDPNSYLSVDPDWKVPDGLLPSEIDILADITTADNNI